MTSQGDTRGDLWTQLQLNMSKSSVPQYYLGRADGPTQSAAARDESLKHARRRESMETQRNDPEKLRWHDLAQFRATSVLKRLCFDSSKLDLRP